MSNDNFITIEVFNNGIKEIKQEISALRTELRAEIQDIRYEEKLNNAKIDWLQHSVYWGFAIIGIIIAFVGIVIALAPFFKKEKIEQEKVKILNENDIRNLIKNEIATANLAFYQGK